MTKSVEDMKKRQKSKKGITAFKGKEAYRWELDLEQQRIRRKRTLDALKESGECDLRWK